MHVALHYSMTYNQARYFPDPMRWVSSAMKRWLAVLIPILALALIYGGHTVVSKRHAPGLFQAAEQAAQQGDFLQAHSLFEESLQLQPGNARAYLLAARAARRAQFQEEFLGPQPGLPANAEQHLEQCRRLGGAVKDIPVESLLLRVHTGEPAHPRLLEALNERASTALALREPAQGESFARRALQISPCDERALYSLYSSLNSQGRQEEARQIQDRLAQARKDSQFLSRALSQLAQSPNDLALRQQIGETYLRLGIPGEAMAWFTGILDYDPRHRPTLQILADYFARNGNADLAAEYRRRLDLAGP